MSSEAYNAYISQTTLSPSTQMTNEDLAEDLNFWSTARFTQEYPHEGTESEVVASRTASPTDAESYAGFDMITLLDSSQENVPDAAAALRAFLPYASPRQQQQQRQQDQHQHATVVNTRPLSPITIPSRSAACLTTPTSTDSFASVFPTTQIVHNVANGANLVMPDPVTPEPSTTSCTSPPPPPSPPLSQATPNAVVSEASASNELCESSSPVDPQRHQQPQQHSAYAFDLEVAAKLAAEEDKRRRNTAASARFRIKKKMREQALERAAREMAGKVHILENRIKDLELENKWLRELVIQKDPVLLELERTGKRRQPVLPLSPTSEPDNDRTGPHPRQPLMQQQLPMPMPPFPEAQHPPRQRPLVFR